MTKAENTRGGNGGQAVKGASHMRPQPQRPDPGRPETMSRREAQADNIREQVEAFEKATSDRAVKVIESAGFHAVPKAEYTAMQQVVKAARNAVVDFHMADWQDFPSPRALDAALAALDLLTKEESHDGQS